MGRFLDLVAAIYHEIPVIAPLIASLIRLIGLGYKAYMMLLRLILFSVAMTPAIVKLVPWWWSSPSIIRGIQYGPNPRNFLDVYLPEEADELSQRPVVVFVTGGAWVIGYKAWAAPLGAYLAKNGIIMVSIDYRNFPQGTLRDMVEDVRKGIQWTIENISIYGGDPDNVSLVGQSAGGHITCMLLLSELGASICDSIRRYIAVGCPYDIVSLAPRLHRRGLYTRVLRSMLDEDLFASSPIRTLGLLSRSAVDRLPPIHIFHGSEDQTVPFHQSVDFAKKLKEVGHKKVELEVWSRVTHTDPILEGPIGGNHYLGASIASLCVEDSEFKHEGAPMIGRHLLKFAKYVMPF